MAANGATYEVRWYCRRARTGGEGDGPVATLTEARVQARALRREHAGRGNEVEIVSRGVIVEWWRRHERGRGWEHATGAELGL